MSKHELDDLLKRNKDLNVFFNKITDLAVRYSNVLKLCETTQEENDPILREGIKLSDITKILSGMSTYLSLQVNSQGQKIISEYLKGDE